MRSAVSVRGVVAVGLAEQLAGALDDGPDQIRVVIRELALQHGGDALEAHAGVDRRPRQRRQLAAGIAVELHEDQVPDFDEAPAGIVGKLLVLAARLGGFGSEIVMDLRARAARAGLAHLPEVVLLIEAEDAVLGNAGHLLPQLLGIVVLAENGDVELVFGQAVLLGDQVPGELDGFGFEVVAEGEIAQHLEERVVAARVADVFQIVVLAAGAHALLRGGGARVIALLQAQENVLELVHARRW